MGPRRTRQWEPEPDGIGSREEGSPPRIPGRQDPGEDPKECSGRTAARSTLKRVGGSATDTEVSRPEGQVRAARAGLVQPDEILAWTRYRSDARPPPGGQRIRTATENKVSRLTGWSGAVGYRAGKTVSLSPDGGSGSSQGQGTGRRVGRTGPEQSPSGTAPRTRCPKGQRVGWPWDGETAPRS